MKLAGILFDKDGTLVDFDATWGRAAYRVIEAMSHGNHATFARLAEAMDFVAGDLRFLPTSPMIAGATADYMPQWAAVLGRTPSPELSEEIDSRFAVETLACLTPVGEPVSVFAALRGLGLRLGVATNDSERGATSQAEKLGLFPFLDFIAGYDSGFGVKPEPGMVRAFVAHTGLSPDEVALVGDSLHDLETAHAAGIRAIAVLSGPAARTTLEPHADHVIASIAELPALVRSLNGLGAE